MKTPETPYINMSKPPVCLHILGQGLVDRLWNEGQELKAYIKQLETPNETKYTDSSSEYNIG